MLLNEKVYSSLSPSSTDVLVKSIVFLSTRCGVPVFNLNIVKPYSFNLSESEFDLLSPCGPPGVLFDPVNISAFK